MKNIFIFVVCGAREHIDTLHFSLPYLQKFSSNEIWVLTDSSRNEVPVIHDHIIDIKTPANFDNHQASIYLKTGIYQFVPKGNKYCYLDTDIIAFSPRVDLIFEQYISPITFAPDHCIVEQFSAYAVYCTCIKVYEQHSKIMEENLIKIDPLRTSNNAIIVESRRKLINFYQENSSLSQKVKIGLKFLFSLKQFRVSEDIYFDKKSKTWRDKDHHVFMNHFKWGKISKQSGLKWNYLKGYPKLPDGRSLWSLTCNHLQEAIEKKFEIKPAFNFQHWNGGVFLFDDQSHDFLSNWFNYTMEIFKDEKWKTRDQGTLIATVWKFGLENHPTLDKQWNLIADYHNPYLKWTENQQVKLGSNEFVDPKLIHVYHHFGDETWGFWNELIEQVNN